MGAATIATAVVALVGAYQNYDANQKMAAAGEANAEEQAKILKIREDQAIKIGGQEAGAYRRNIEKLKGSQASATAASGVVVGVGSSADIMAETEQLAQEDINRIKNNAMLEAWGYQKQATNIVQQANLNSTAYKNKGTASLLGGIAQAGLSAYGNGNFADDTTGGGSSGNSSGGSKPWFYPTSGDF